MAKRRKKTSYQKAFGLSKTACSTGKATDIKKRDAAIEVYKKDAKAKGKTSAQIKKTIAYLKACPT